MCGGCRSLRNGSVASIEVPGATKQVVEQEKRSENPVPNQPLVELGPADIRELIPHRGEALCLDSAVFDPNTQTLTAFMEFTPERSVYFLGHFPGHPVHPAHWQYESMSLAAAILFAYLNPDFEGVPVFVGTNGKVRYQRSIYPGDKIEIHARIDSKRQASRKKVTLLQLNFATKITKEGRTVAFINKLIGSSLPKADISMEIPSQKESSI